ncbi:MAG: tetratricopeptide repeat protein [Planctomycetota bacterium]|nr:MAG: tetratricopeptide repeat protein [Planctomycetota bacterium]
MYQHQYNLAIGHVIEILETAPQEEKFWIYIVLAKLHEEKKDFSSAIQYCYQALQNLPASQTNLTLLLKTILGTNLKNLGDLEKGEEYLLEALEGLGEKEVEEDPNLPKGLKGEVLFHLGEIYRLKNSCETALSCYLQGKDIFKSRKRWHYYYESLSKMGLLYLKTEQWKESRDMFRQVMAFYKKVQNQEKLGETYYYLGLALKKGGKRHSAMTFLKKSLEFLSSKPSYLLGMVYFNLAKIAAFREDFASAESFILKAIQVFDEIQNYASMSEAQRALEKIQNQNQINEIGI